MSECPLLAQSGQWDRARVCPLLDNSGQSRIVARDSLSANDPKRTCGRRRKIGQAGMKLFPERRSVIIVPTNALADGFAMKLDDLP